MADTPPGYDEFASDAMPPTERAPATAVPTPPGYDDFAASEINDEKHGTALELGKTALEGLSKGLTGPIGPYVENAILGNRKEQLEREEANPVTSGIAEGAGLVGGSLFAPEATLGGALHAIGAGTKTAAEAAGIGKIGSAAVSSAIENMVYQGQNEVGKLILQDPGQSADTAITSMGLAGLVGGTFGAIPPLWHATMGKQTGSILGAITDKLGGVEGSALNPAADALAKSGTNIAPEIKALASQNPAVQEMARTLQQTDTSASGKAFQKSYRDMEKQAGDSMVAAMGKTPAEVTSMPEVSTHEVGKKLASTLAGEYETQLNPFAKGFDEVKSKLQGVELQPSVADKAEDAMANQAKLQVQLDKAVKAAVKAQAAGDPGIAIEAASKVQDLTNAMKAAKEIAERPGTADVISDKIAKRAIQEGWVTSPSSDIMREVNRVAKELPLQKNLKNLGDFITQVGNNTNKDPMNGPLRRAGSIISSIMKEAEGDVMASHIGSEAGPDAVEHLRALQEGYRVQSALKEGIADRLGMKGASTSGYAGAIRELASTDAEGVLRKLSGKNDADWLDFVQKHYPKTAEVLRDYHRNDLFGKATSKAAEGATIDNASFLKHLHNMPKELRDFVASREAQSNITSIGAALEAFKNPNYNYSNTARTLMSQLKDHWATALGGATALMGHGVPTAALIATLGKTIGKEAPDAIRLALLRFLGSNQPLEAGAFKNMVEYLHHTVKGETLLSNAAKNIFKAGSEVIPAHMMPKETDRNKLGKAVDAAIKNPAGLMDIAGNTGHYLPGHASALAKTAAGTLQFIASQKPNTAKASPLDTQRQPNATEKAQYNRTLDLMQQPLMVFKHIADGTLTPTDIITIKTNYPGFYNRSIQKLTDNLMEAVNKGTVIPYKTKMGLSLYAGQPLDSTMQPGSIVAAQPAPQSMPSQAPAGKAPSRSTASLSKMPKMYKTQAQGAEEDRINRK